MSQGRLEMPSDGQQVISEGPGQSGLAPIDTLVLKFMAFLIMLAHGSTPAALRNSLQILSKSDL